VATGILFSGQGAQQVGMGREFAHLPILIECFERASDVIHRDLKKLCLEGPQEDLTRTDVCQIALYTVGYGIFKALMALEILSGVSAYAGLSLGEWTALAAAGSIAFEDGLHLVARRGELMDEACQRISGGMLSLIGGLRENVFSLCERTGLYPSNFNAVDQVVISGDREKINKALVLAKDFGFRRAILLNVAGAYHSPLMASARNAFAKEIRELKIQRPRGVVFSNVTGKPHGEPEIIRQLLIDQITSPVQWHACIQNAATMGIDHFYECGSGKVLIGLVKKSMPAAVAFEAREILASSEAVR
jgi:[acyl-carrier-protein] S-malonyltransferase